MRRASLFLLLLLWIPTFVVGVAGAHAGGAPSVDIVGAHVAGPRGPEPAQAAYTDPADPSSLTLGSGPPPRVSVPVRARPPHRTWAAHRPSWRAVERLGLDAALGQARAHSGFLTTSTSLAPPTGRV